MTAPILFPFKYFDPLRGRWMNARYKAAREVIAAQYERWEITGPGEQPSPFGGGHTDDIGKSSK